MTTAIAVVEYATKLMTLFAAGHTSSMLVVHLGLTSSS